MEEKYNNLVNAFRNLHIEDKKKEIIKHNFELLKLLYDENTNFDSSNTYLPLLDSNYTNEDEFLDLLFTCIISLKEENAKLINCFDNK